jgi:hypothetical protein
MRQKLWITLITCLAYCIDRELWKAIEYLKEQVRVLKEQQEKDKPILLTDHQRIRIAAKAKELTRRLLEETSVLFTPDTILGWYRRLIAQKYDGSESCNDPGRPRISQEIVDLVVRFKKENPRWGYTRIGDYIVYLGYKIGDTTVRNILIENGHDPDLEAGGVESDSLLASSDIVLGVVLAFPLPETCHLLYSYKGPALTLGRSSLGYSLGYNSPILTHRKRDLHCCKSLFLIW